MITWATAYYLSEWLIRLVMLVYVPNRRSPAAARTWLLLIFLLPWPGLILYSVLGRVYLNRARIDHQNRASAQIRAARFQMPEIDAFAGDLSPLHKRTSELATRLGDFNPVGGNDVKLMADYNGSIDALIADIRAAAQHVHLLYYIFEDDSTGNRVCDALIDAAGRGVKCRLLLDAVGSARGLRRLSARLRAANIEVLAALPVSFLRSKSGRIDLRNHRKIAVIDGTIGHLGSQNIVDPLFVPGYPNEEVVARVSGPIVAHLQATYLADRYLETLTPIDEPGLFPECAPTAKAVLQMVPSGPGYGRENAQTLMVNLLHAASKRVIITTPYFVPDEPFLQAMTTAVLRGAEVHLVVPAHSNQPITRLAQQSYFEQILDAGVIIHLYQPRFLHAKHMSVDDELALVGSSNIDIRSFALNAEISMLVYDAATIAQLAAIQEHYFAGSKILTKESWSKRSVFTRTTQNVARLADALL